MGLIKCPDCGKEISDKSLYCLNCGCHIGKGEIPKKSCSSCPNCGNPLEDGIRYCSECGAKLVLVNAAPIYEGKVSMAPVKRENKANNSKKTGGVLAVIAMACGIAGLCLSFIYIGILPIIAGFILAIVAFCMETPKKWMAWTGVITSVLGLLVFCVVSGADVNVNSGYKAGTEESKIETTKERKKVVEKDSSLLVDNEEEKISIESTEIYNGNGVSIVLSEIEQSKNETTISFLLTSTSDKDYSISAHTYSVNGLMAGGNVVGSDVDLPAGKKAKFSVKIENQWLAGNGIEKIAQLDFLFWAYYDNFKEWDSGIVEVKTNLFNESLRYSPLGEEVYSDENITIWYIGNSQNDYSFAIRNNNSYNSDYTVENCSVNDWSYEIIHYTYDLYNEPILANSYDVFTLSVENGFMEEYDIFQIESIEFSITLGNKTTEKIKITN